MKMPFERRRKEKQAKLWAKTTKMLVDGHEQRERELHDAADNATRNATFHSTTVWQLQYLVDQLRQENIRLKMEAERPSGDSVIALNHNEATLAHNFLDLYVPWLEEDDLYFDRRPQLNALIDRLHEALS